MTDPLLEQFATALAEPVAERVAELLADKLPTSGTSSPWLDVDEAAAYLRTTKDAIYKLTAAKPTPAIPCHRLGDDGKGRLRFHRDELDAWLEERYEGPPRAGIPPLRSVG